MRYTKNITRTRFDCIDMIDRRGAADIILYNIIITNKYAMSQIIDNTHRKKENLGEIRPTRVLKNDRSNDIRTLFFGSN